jgi:tagaturonate epimerase
VVSRAAPTEVPHLRPTPIGTASSFGFGDRTGRATPGHIRAIRSSGTTLVPVLAQQSARELERTGRTFTDVLGSAIRGAAEAGWTEGFAADADHLRTLDEVVAALEAGFTMLTLDPSAHVDETEGDLDRRLRELPWAALEDDWPSLRRRHAGAADDATLARTAVMLGRALVHVSELARPARERDVDIEVSIDETATSTTPFAHRFLAIELQRLGVRFTSIAPRFSGRWQKAIDVEGDPDEIRASIAAHARVAAEHGDYKLSIHSGSDKFSVYPLLAELAPRLHVKTSGTSYLEAVRVVADAEPDLFREILDVSRERFAVDRATYELSPTAGIPPDADLDQPGVRQGLHVTFGAVLTHPEIGPALLATLDAHADAYSSALEAHLGRHLVALA